MMDETKLSHGRRQALSARFHRKRQEEDSYYVRNGYAKYADEESQPVLCADRHQDDDANDGETPDSQGTRHRVKFATANYAAYEHRPRRKRPSKQRPEFVQRGAPQRNTTADYDVEDMDEGDDDEGDSPSSADEQAFEEQQRLRRQRQRLLRQQRWKQQPSGSEGESSGHEVADQTLMSHGTVEQDTTTTLTGKQHQSMFVHRRKSRAGPDTSRVARQDAIARRYLLADPSQALETTNMNVFKEKSMVSSVAPLAHMSYLASTKGASVKRKRRNRADQ